MKTLATSPNGLNDLFSTLAILINFYKKINLNIEDIGLYTSKYQNLNRYFDFLKIKYFLKKPRNYNIFSTMNGSFTNLNLQEEYHISNFVKIKNNILKEALSVSKPIGFHFRFMSHEKFNEKEMIFQKKQYIDFFLKKYDKNKEYIIVSDSNLLDNFFLNYKNVFFEPKPQVYSSSDARINFLKETVKDLALLSWCDVIYKTRGNFPSLAYALSEKNIKPKIIKLY